MEPFLLLGLLVASGYILGIVGFFRANSAHTEIHALRRAFADLAARIGAEPAPFVVPPTATQTAGPSPVPPPIPARATSEPPPLVEPASIAPAPVAPTPIAPASIAATTPPRDLETILTARWGVWLGSAALLLAGVFLIRYAVEQELLGPAARCLLAALLGIALIAAAEWLTRHEPPSIPGPIQPDQAPAGLAAGGTAVLFGAAYGAGPFYDLLPPLLGFAALAAASFVGLLAALRYGPLTAATGIVGAFATPALVATENPSLPGQFAYLTVVTAASLAVVRYTAWTWLGWAATIAGAVWICLAAFQGGPDLWAAGAFIPVAAALNVFLLPAAALDHPAGRRLAWVPFAAVGLAGLVLESQDPEYGSIVGLLMLSPVAVARGHGEPRLDRLPWIAALFGLLTLLLWNLPTWVATGETITVEGIVEAFFPGAWAPDAIRPLIFAAASLAAFHAAAGLWMERRARRPLHWAALVAAVPVLALLVAYAKIAHFQADFRWAVVGLALSAGLTVTAALARNEADRQRAGVHAAGAVAALALGCAMLLHDHWLTLAVALFLPALAWIEARADLPPLRQVALAVATLVLVRLVLNWYVLDYAFGARPLANGLIAAYAAPAAAFWFAALLFRRRADDLLVATLEAGAVAFTAIFIALEIRHWYGEGQLVDPFNFREVAIHLLTLSVQATAWLYVARRTGRPVLGVAARVMGGLAMLGGSLAILFSPAVTGAHVDVPTLLAAYLIPAALAVLARRFVTEPEIRRALGIYALVAGFAWITLQIRYLFHPGHMDVIFGTIEDAELWSWSGAWLLYGIALMVRGILADDRLLRFAALGVVGLVCLKVFLVDMADLTGLWRVLSFLGLGLVLIGLGVLHRRFVLATKHQAMG
jgi:uncharacterized membrane protein